jgi:hypothetical protein
VAAFLLAVLLITAAPLASGFTAPSILRSRPQLQRHNHDCPMRSLAAATTAATERTVQGTIFSGEPNARALTLEHRSILAQYSVWNPSGDAVHLDDLLGKNGERDTPCIAVFLRSLG